MFIATAFFGARLWREDCKMRSRAPTLCLKWKLDEMQGVKSKKVIQKTHAASGCQSQQTLTLQKHFPVQPKMFHRGLFLHPAPALSLLGPLGTRDHVPTLRLSSATGCCGGVSSVEH